MARRRRPSRWQPFDLRDVPRKSGVYALYDATRALVYIGSSGNIRTRVQMHMLKPWGVCAVKASIMRGDWYRREQRLIRRLRPKQNKRIVFRIRVFRSANR